MYELPSTLSFSDLSSILVLVAGTLPANPHTSKRQFESDGSSTALGSSHRPIRSSYRITQTHIYRNIHETRKVCQASNFYFSVSRFYLAQQGENKPNRYNVTSLLTNGYVRRGLSARLQTPLEVALEGAPTRCPGRESVTGTYGQASWSRRFAVVLVCPLRSCGLPAFPGRPCEAMHLSRPVLCRCVFGNATYFRGTEPTVPVLRASPCGR